MPRALVQSQKADEISAADTLLEQLLSLHQKTLGLLSRAERTGDIRCALFAIREGRSNLELLAKLSDELTEAKTLNITVSPEWINLRSNILRVLEQFPQAHVAISEALSDRR